VRKFDLDGMLPSDVVPETAPKELTRLLEIELKKNMIPTDYVYERRD
jgi:hypothetical protein